MSRWRSDTGTFEGKDFARPSTAFAEVGPWRAAHPLRVRRKKGNTCPTIKRGQTAREAAPPHLVAHAPNKPAPILVLRATIQRPRNPKSGTLVLRPQILVPGLLATGRIQQTPTVQIAPAGDADALAAAEAVTSKAGARTRTTRTINNRTTMARVARAAANRSVDDVVGVEVAAVAATTRTSQSPR